MTKRLRYYVRQGWNLVHINGQNYHDMHSWCSRLFAPGEWHGKLHGLGEGSRFVFLKEQDAALFTLRWLKDE